MQSDLLTLFKQYTNGNRRVEYILFNRLKKQFFPVCRKYSPTDFIAEEAFQLGTLKAFKMFHTYQGKGNIVSWLYSIYRFSAYDRVRVSKQEQIVEINEDVISDDYEVPNYEYFEESSMIRSREYVNNLSDNDYLILFMRSMEELTYEEIGKRLNMNRSTVLRRYNKLCETIKKF